MPTYYYIPGTKFKLYCLAFYRVGYDIVYVNMYKLIEETGRPQG